jgi:hypothetical protein
MDEIHTILEVVTAGSAIESAVVVVPDGAGAGGLAIRASAGLPEAALTGLAAAIREPDHPIARTIREPVATWDVRPTRPGGPALRSHLPLAPGEGDGDVAGVLAVAYEQPLDVHARREIEAAASRIADLLDEAS